MTVAAAGAVLGVLALVLGVGVWVGLALFAPGLVSLAVFRTMPVEKLLAQLTWNATTTPELIALPALHPDGRDPVPLAALGFALHRACAVDNPPAGAAAARQRARLHHVRGDLGLLGRDHRDRGAHHADRAAAARLRPRSGDGLARGRGHAGLPDSAQHHPHHLRRALGDLDPQALLAGHRSGAHARRALHDLARHPRALEAFGRHRKKRRA